MDETIGVKGGHNDRRRVMSITKKQKERLTKYQREKEIKQLEKEVKKKQRYTLIKMLPIAITGQTIKKLTENKNKKENIKDIEIKEDDISYDDVEIEEVIIVLKNGKKQVINVPKNKEIKIKKEKEEKVKEEIQDTIEIPKTKENISIEFEDLNENQKNKLKKLQSRKIIDVYERQLKDIRYELRNLIIEYNTLIDEEDNIIKSREEEKILDRLNSIIKKIEELKEKIKIEDLDKYDDNYIYTLIEEYLSDFKDKKVIKDIKDSELYILISSKLDELDKKKEKFKEKVKDKKEELSDKEEKFDKLKEKLNKIDKINKEIEDFYKDQELVLKEIREKIDNAVTVSERVEVQLKTMNFQTKKLLRKLSLFMLLPGPRGARAYAALTRLYANMAEEMINPKTTTKKYKVIKVADYSRDIENSIEKIDDARKTLSSTSNDIDKLISKIKTEFSEYIGVIKECDNLLSNLEEIKSNIREKEYELEKIKEKQELELQRNNAKVLKRGEYQL